MSERYRLMIYFAHSTMMIYDKGIIIREDMSIDEFRTANPELIKRVFDEGLSIFNYELSMEQMDKAIKVYSICKYRPNSVHETEAYQLKG